MNVPGSIVDVPAPAGRSVLVSVLGWLAIASGALTLLAAFNQGELYGMIGEAPIGDVEPAMQEGLSRLVSVVTALNVALGAFLMYAGYALWKRRNWARRTFIVLFALGIAANLIWVVFAMLFGSMLAQTGLGFGPLIVVILIVALGFAGLSYWFIRRLRSPAVKSEFA